ncbi:MAG: Rid family detoxifying hydrolase, partial [Vicinamibacteria bacterium]|nr:Rid family detoxifying hydrolase [Vicinamibacteria bacterium]
MPKKHILSKQAPEPIGPYSQAVIAGGLVFVSGQIPVDPVTGKIVGDGIEEQTERVLKNVLAILHEAGMAAENVVRTTVYLVDLTDFERMNEVYDRYLGKMPPARAT